jgi:lipopolysaccharide/colanic/teichoic acid biosynthesis glycosyltransferase
MHEKRKLYISGNNSFWVCKRIFDILISFLFLPILILFIIVITLLNLFFNKGSVLFIQKRMGKDCKPFNAIKFRTMINIDTISRKYTDPLELERITTLGKVLRKLRIDELPQIINVIKGDMSLIGPRPDFYDHAIIFLECIPDYKNRHAIRPGISGLSQIRLGYAEGLLATKKKSRIDIFYIENVNFNLELKIFFGTIGTIVRGIGN